jgi:hypothetical protein
MPDLSEMLGDVYGAPEEPTETSAPSESASPAWADDEHLDRAFADWTPGPDANAPAAERGMFTPAPPAGRLADDLAAALSEAVMAETDVAESEAAVTEAPVTAPMTATALGDLEPQPEPEPEPEPMAFRPHKAGWQRSDDDIIPTGKTTKGGVRLPRPARAGKAPKVGKADTAPKKARRSFGDLMKMEIGGKKK